MTTTFKVDYATLVRQAVIGAFKKLNPRDEIKNLVMFVVWLGSILTTFWLFVDFSSCNLQIQNCTVATNLGEGIRWNGSSSYALAVSNSIVWANGDDLVNFPTNAAGTLSNVWYCDTQNGDNLNTNGCISADPLFVNPPSDYHEKSIGGHWTTNGWLRDSVTSPCVNAGDPHTPYNLEPEPNGKRVNMGRYGNTPEATLSPVVKGTFVKLR